MIVKAIDIRDRGTFIPALAVKMVPDDEDANQYGRERYLLFAWGGGTRTYQIAHQYIIDHFDELESGAVVDVEFILKETTEPKKSEREG